jgi:hypothetical protein
MVVQGEEGVVGSCLGIHLALKVCIPQYHSGVSTTGKLTNRMASYASSQSQLVGVSAPSKRLGGLATAAIASCGTG